jgi:hypothetical protein
MSKRVSYIITDNNITVNYDGQTHIVPRKDSLADRLIDAIRNKNLDEIPRLVSVSKRVEEFGQGNFVVQDGRIMINGVAAPELLSRKILRFMNEGLPFEPLVKFAENLLKNPSFRAVNELFQFLEKNDHPITDNGCFIAYKKVRNDFLDGHTGTIDNSPGRTVEIPRNQVNEDPTQTCSYGLHVANWDYANNIYTAGMDPKMLEVEVNPADVVAVPIDYNQAKMRVSRYIVLGVVDQEHSTETALRIISSSCNNCDNCSCDNDLDDAASDDYEETRECIECGEVLSTYENDICDNCEIEMEENEYTCQDCGGEVDAIGDELCAECEEDKENKTGNNEITEQEDDRYPWEDELDQE